MEALPDNGADLLGFVDLAKRELAKARAEVKRNLVAMEKRRVTELITAGAILYLLLSD